MYLITRYVGVHFSTHLLVKQFGYSGLFLAVSDSVRRHNFSLVYPFETDEIASEVVAETAK